jgi:hypothetical protein
MDKPKVVAMNQPPDKMAEALDHVRRNMQAIVDYQILMAQVRRSAYDAHVDEGFTPEQSLELVKKLW